MDIPNNMHMRQLSREEIIEIYTGPAKRHFPADELKPLSIIEQLYDKGFYEGLGLFAEERLYAYALFIQTKTQTAMLLDYYAVMEEHRSSGMGSIFLGKMKEFYKDRSGILLETEDPACTEDEEERLIRNKRNAFYLRNGADFTDTGSKLFGVQFRILYLPLGERPDNGRQFEELEKIYEVMLGDEFSRHVKMWRIPDGHSALS